MGGARFQSRPEASPARCRAMRCVGRALAVRHWAGDRLPVRLRVGPVFLAPPRRVPRFLSPPCEGGGGPGATNYRDVERASSSGIAAGPSRITRLRNPRPRSPSSASPPPLAPPSQGGERNGLRHGLSSATKTRWVRPPRGPTQCHAFGCSRRDVQIAACQGFAPRRGDHNAG